MTASDVSSAGEGGGEADVLIIGGGPAGTTLAIGLTRAGLSVILLEADIHPKRPVCGEFLSVEGMTLLTDLGLSEIVEPALLAPMLGIRLHCGTLTSRMEFPAKGSNGSRAINRLNLEHLLEQAAIEVGVQVVRGQRAVAFDRRLDGWRVTTQQGHHWQTDLLIGADGRRSAVARQLALSQPTAVKQVAIRAFLPVRAERHQSIDMILMPPHRYLGITPVEPHLWNASLVVPASDLMTASSAMALFCDSANGIKLLKEQVRWSDWRPEVQCVSPVSHWVSGVTGPDAALIGDAAGFVAPLTGEGLTTALWTARMLLQQLIPLWRQDDWTHRQQALNRYEQILKTRRRLRHSLATGLVKGIGNTGLCTMGCQMAAMLPNWLRSSLAGVMNHAYLPYSRPEDAASDSCLIAQPR